MPLSFDFLRDDECNGDFSPIIPKTSVALRDNGRRHLVAGHSLWPKCPTEFDGDEITLGSKADVRVGHNPLPTSVPDDEQVVARFDGPAQASIRTDVLGCRVVLNERRQHEIGIPSIRRARGPKALDEIAAGQMAKVVLSFQIELNSAFR